MSTPISSVPKNLDLEQLDDDDFEDIDALSPKKAASILKKLDLLRYRIKGKAIEGDKEFLLSSIMGFVELYDSGDKSKKKKEYRKKLISTYSPLHKELYTLDPTNLFVGATVMLLVDSY
ncbi:hypothetical protein RIF29_14871 [Crotalaria pallida]|uniref:Uncharacterized protein n=1 Tax=Crotalaria pallida TaxID=3830 RepID=A0AAN9FIY8_CROPI